MISLTEKQENALNDLKELGFSQSDLDRIRNNSLLLSQKAKRKGSKGDAALYTTADFCPIQKFPPWFGGN